MDLNARWRFSVRLHSAWSPSPSCSRLPGIEEFFAKQRHTDDATTGAAAQCTRKPITGAALGRTAEMLQAGPRCRPREMALRPLPVPTGTLWLTGFRPRPLGGSMPAKPALPLPFSRHEVPDTAGSGTVGAPRTSRRTQHDADHSGTRTAPRCS